MRRALAAAVFLAILSPTVARAFTPIGTVIFENRRVVVSYANVTFQDGRQFLAFYMHGKTRRNIKVRCSYTWTDASGTYYLTFGWFFVRGRRTVKYQTGQTYIDGVTSITNVACQTRLLR
jgi:hypothetical protein